MSGFFTPLQATRGAAIGFVVIVVATGILWSRRVEDAATIAPLERGEADALVLELARCRTVTSDQIAALEDCRRAWAENRRKFFTTSKTPTSPMESLPAASTKYQDRFPTSQAGQPRGEVR
jgi:conjugative transfer region protein TrbK